MPLSAAASTASLPPISVIATVFNEIDHLDRLVASLGRQSRLPSEIVIADGGSRDGTWERLQKLSVLSLLGPVPLVVLSRPGANISAGRNAAIAAARGTIIACTDAGVELVDTWLEAITAPFADGARVVSGSFSSDPVGAFETALGATTLPERAEIDPARFLPSSRSVAFLKEGWAAAGGYPEWLDYCEDLVFDLRLLASAGPAAFAPDAIARFRPRPTLAAFARQYYRYARGDGKAGLWPGRHAIRYATYIVAIPALIGIALYLHPLAWLALLAGLGAMVRTPYRRLARQWSALGRTGRLQAILWVPVIRVTGDLAKMLGYPAGVAWRLRHRPPAWRPEPGAGRM